MDAAFGLYSSSYPIMTRQCKRLTLQYHLENSGNVTFQSIVKIIFYSYDSIYNWHRNCCSSNSNKNADYL